MKLGVGGVLASSGALPVAPARTMSRAAVGSSEAVCHSGARMHDLPACEAHTRAAAQLAARLLRYEHLRHRAAQPQLAAVLAQPTHEGVD